LHSSTAVKEDSSESQLVELARRGDREAFATLYECNFNRVYRYLRVKIRDEQASQDLCQETFMRAWQNLSQAPNRVPNEVSFKPWLYAIARRIIIDYVRQEAKIGKSISLEQDDVELQANPQMQRALIVMGPEEQVIQRELVALALGQIAPLRLASLLMKAEGFSYEQIASRLAITPRSARDSISKGRKELRDAFLSLAEDP